jgi:hypothetical protein
MTGELMLSRRNCVLAPVAALTVGTASAAPLPVPQSGRIAFQMIRKGDVIGSHVVEFAQQGDTLNVAVAIDILVKFGPVPMYRYKHRATEIWRRGVFNSIESVTNRDGSPHHMRAELTSAGLMVEGSRAERYRAPDNTYPTTYWNRVMLQNNVINSEDGRLFVVQPMALDEEVVPAAKGTLRARHYKLDGDLPLDLWYDASDQWAHLVFTKDGSTVIYQKL